MTVITFVGVENFRSIRSSSLEGLEDYAAIVGLNSAGKSNVLRALNLFFNGYLDEQRSPLVMSDDFSSFAPKRKRKTISVTVGFRIGDEFKVRGQEAFHAAAGITDELFIRRQWSLGLDKSTVIEALYFGADIDNLTEAAGDDLASVLTHIRAVRFVYVPNHARAADLIKSELAPLRSNLVARLRSTKAYRESSVDGLLGELRDMGTRMFGDTSKALTKGLPGVGLEPDLPGDFADLVFTMGVNAIADGEVARAPEFEGSGAQSFMLLHVLDLADRTRRAGGFGWVQASVWAMEEPESFLHAALRAQFSTDLHEYSTDSKRQVLVTTHQDEFVRVAQHAWFAAKGPDTIYTKMTARDALEASMRASVTSFAHPLFAYPTEPIVIVEGKFDEVHLRAAMQSAGMRPRWRLLSPSAAFGEDIGGDSVRPYLQYNKQVIASRPLSAPVLVLRDWEASDAGKYDVHLKVHPYSRCLVAPEHLVNPRLDQSFVGIERYVSTELIEKVVPSEDLGLENALQDARYRIKRPVLDSMKPTLAKAVRDGGETPGKHMKQLVEWLDDEVVKILDSVPASAFS
ncbi:ATP-dependent nuclease [Microbacterium paraoxydans]|uniref:ATP-dependent nuclease n=1 Tax=Microbacterium paraoxydans TaxID=199592 RepID=UPI0011A9B225|nr:AAA family ATPase [Microbacterium paraoxydans]